MPVYDAIRDLLCPPSCLGCRLHLSHSRPPLLCRSCLALVFPISSPLCTCCGLPFPCGEDHLCHECLTNTFSFDLARSPFFYQSLISSLTVKFKFSNKLENLTTLAALIRQSPLFPYLTRPDLIIPVPLHKKRLQERGFNQSLLLSEKCFPDWQSLMVHQGLIRHRPTVPQVSLSGRQRRKNLKGAFKVNINSRTMTGKNILLVDDVFTTGATVSECSRVLKNAGAVRVEVFTGARSVPYKK